MPIDNKEDLPNKQIKMIPRSLNRQRGYSPSDEIKEARKTPAYWWYRTLQVSDEYQLCCRNEGKGKLELLYRDFGDVRKDFAMWWMAHGRKIFAEQSPLKKVKKIDKNKINDLSLHKDRLIIEIPLAMRKQTAMRQIGRLVKEAYEGREIDIWKQSTAKRQIIKSKVRMSTVEILIKIYGLRNQFPTLSNYEIGLKAGIDLDIYARDTSGVDIDLSVEKRRMTIAVSRYLGQARNLIANAEMGVFPSLNELKNIK
jgi:hypothetical protein